MKKIISLILVLAMSLCMTCAVSAAAADSPGGSSPVTGDNNMLGFWLLVMGLSLVAIVVVAVVYYRSTKKTVE